MALKTKRVQELAAKSDGLRMLVDRLWPRGISKERAHLDEWNKVLPPSNTLRTLYHSGQLDFRMFSAAYRMELSTHPDELDRLRNLAKQGTVTLLYASANTTENHVLVLEQVLKGH